MTDDQESDWWETVDDGSRLVVHGLMVLLTWPMWLLGKIARRRTRLTNGSEVSHHG